MQRNPIPTSLLGTLARVFDSLRTFIFCHFSHITDFDMTSLACPNCQHQVHLPEGISPAALLQCPMCGITVTASQLTAVVGPTWIVVDPATESTAAPAVPSETTQPATMATAATNAAGTEESSDPSGSTDEQEYDLEDSPKADRTRRQPVKQQDWSKFKPISHDEYQRRKRKSSSPITAMVQVILGGFLALPIAQLLIWHVLGKDPFELAPKVASAVPWIVPEKFRPYTSPNEERFGTSSSSRRSSSSPSGIGRDFDAELAASIAESENKPRGKENNPTSPKEMKEESESVKAKGDNNTPKPTEPTPTEPTPDQPGNKELPEAPASKLDGEKEPSPQSAGERLTLAIVNTRNALTAWEPAQSDAESRRKVANDFYSNLSLTVEQFALIANEPSARIFKKEVEKLLRDVAKEPEFLQLVRAGGFAKLSRPATTKPGTGLALLASFEKATSESSNETTKDDAQGAEPNAEEKTLETTATGTTGAVAIESSWTLKIRKSLIASSESNENAADVKTRSAVLRNDVLLGEQVAGEYLVLISMESATNPSVEKSAPDIVWFAIPIE